MKKFALLAVMALTLGTAACTNPDNTIYVEEWNQEAPRVERTVRQTNDALRK